MQELPKGHSMAPPNRCFICEASPQREAGERVVDTLRDFNPMVRTPLNGRKYVCSNCIDTMAKALGYVSEHDVVQQAREVSAARELLAQFRDRVASFGASLSSEAASFVDVAQSAVSLPDRLTEQSATEEVQQQEVRSADQPGTTGAEPADPATSEPSPEPGESPKEGE